MPHSYVNPTAFGDLHNNNISAYFYLVLKVLAKVVKKKYDHPYHQLGSWLSKLLQGWPYILGRTETHIIEDV